MVVGYKQRSLERVKRIDTAELIRSKGKGFQKGHQKFGGRKLSVANRITTELEIAILEAAANVGYPEITDPNDVKKIIKPFRPGIVAYLEYSAEVYRKEYLQVLMRVLPHIISTRTTVKHEVASRSVSEIATALLQRGIDLARLPSPLSASPVIENTPSNSEGVNDGKSFYNNGN